MWALQLCPVLNKHSVKGASLYHGLADSQKDSHSKSSPALSLTLTKEWKFANDDSNVN